MSFDLCRVRVAQKPFYIENISTYIYSIEELCFFLKENVYLIDDSVMNEALCDWIRDELGLRTLYRQLYEQLESGAGIAAFVLPIFREIGYLTPRQLKSYQDTVGKLSVQPEDARDKLKGDYLARSGMYGSAVSEYLNILDRRGRGGAGAQFYAQVLGNLGCAYARLFRFEDAADAFYRSWRMAKNKEALQRYISVLPFFLSAKETERRIRELDADPEILESVRSYAARLARQAAEKAGEKSSGRAEQDRAQGNAQENAKESQQGGEAADGAALMRRLEERKSEYRRMSKEALNNSASP